MEVFAISTSILALVWACLVLLIRRNLRQRARARALRDAYIVLASDLIGKPEFPEAHARHLVGMASIPEGWLTRFMALRQIKVVLMGETPRSRRRSDLRFEQVPHHLRAKYAKAILTFLWSDSYRCALLGRVVRGMNSWIFQAIEDVKPDVNAHATQSVVNLVNEAHPPKRYIPDAELACLA